MNSSLRNVERQALRRSYFGELGRGAFHPLCAEFPLLVAISWFGVDQRELLWLLSSAVFIGMLSAVLGASLTARFPSRNVILGLETVSRLLAIAAALAPTGLSFALLMAGAIAMNSTSQPLISGIYGSHFRSVVRGQAVGRLHSITVGATAFSALAIGWMIGAELAWYRGCLIGIACLSLALSWRGYFRFPDPEDPSLAPPPISIFSTFGDIFRVVLRDRAFLFLEFYWFFFGGANLWLNPIRVIRLESIGFDPGQVMVATTAVTYATMALTVRWWGRIVYSLNFGLYRIFLGGLLATGTWIFFHSESFWLVCLGSFVMATGLAGGTLSWRLVATFFTRSERIPLYMCVHLLFCGARGILGPWLSLSLMDALGPVALSNISVGVFLAVSLLMIPFVPVIERRRREVSEAESGGLQEDEKKVCGR